MHQAPPPQSAAFVAAASLLPPYLSSILLRAPPAAQAAPQQQQEPQAPAMQVPPAAPQQEPAVLLPPPPPPPLPVPALKECCVCLEDVAQADLLVLLPCMHRCVCADCAAALLADARPCPKCRERVERAARVYED
jgi:hypothetical protein